MRLPTSKIYRAFPELDNFSDESCEKFVLQAKSRRWVSRLLMAAGCVVLLIGGPMMLAGVLAFFARWLRVSGFMALQADAWMAWIAAAVMLFGFGGIFWSMIALRDRWLRRAIQGLLTKTTCAGCGYSLLGLVILEGKIRCPECGILFALGDHGLTEEMLMGGEWMESQQRENNLRLLAAKDRALRERDGRGEAVETAPGTAPRNSAESSA